MAAKKTTARGSQPAESAPPADTQPAATADPKPAPKPAATAEQLLRLADNLSEEERDKLRQIGVVFSGGLHEDSLVEPTWGYRCPSCNAVAVYFPGETFGPSRAPEPRAGMTLDELNWTQPVPLERQNRQHPLCQSCGAQAALGAGRSLLGRLIVRVSDFTATRDKHFDYLEKLRLKRELDALQTGDALGGANHSYDQHGKASELLSPQQRADVEAFGDAVDSGQIDLAGALDAN